MNIQIHKGRFAPSPTGRMHLGNVFSAMMSWLSVKSKGGQWLLRIEDIDRQRSRQEYADMLMRDLEWLGLTWDEGPYYQSERGEIYEECLKRLADKDLTYPCYCSRADIMATQAPHESDGRVVYKGTCRTLSPVEAQAKYGDKKPATRIMVPDSDVTFVDAHYGPQTLNLARHCGDFVLRRADGAWAYQLAVVVDDAMMGITEIVRGRDLLLSVAQQSFLYQQLGITDSIPQFIHHPLICNTALQRLSKRDRSLDLGALRESYSAEELFGILAFTVGIKDTPEPISAVQLLDIFQWENVPTDDVVIDEKLINKSLS